MNRLAWTLFITLSLSVAVGLLCGYLNAITPIPYQDILNRAFFIISYSPIIALAEIVRRKVDHRVIAAMAQFIVVIYIGDSLDEIFEEDPSVTGNFEIFFLILGVLSAYLEFKQIYVFNHIRYWINTRIRK